MVRALGDGASQCEVQTSILRDVDVLITEAVRHIHRCRRRPGDGHDMAERLPSRVGIGRHLGPG